MRGSVTSREPTDRPSMWEVTVQIQGQKGVNLWT